MIKVVLTGLWVCVITVASSYAAAYWSAGKHGDGKQEVYLEGIEYQKIQAITVPMIAEGGVQGYVVAKLVFTADARTLRDLAVPPHAFVVDEAFREIYSNGKVDFGNIAKYNLGEMTDAIKKNVNKRLNFDVVQDVLVEEINYVEKSDIRQ
jgi:hypothetical protein